jgi:hypothetical protein
MALSAGMSGVSDATTSATGRPPIATTRAPGSSACAAVALAIQSPSPNTSHSNG